VSDFAIRINFSSKYFVQSLTCSGFIYGTPRTPMIHFHTRAFESEIMRFISYTGNLQTALSWKDGLLVVGTFYTVIQSPLKYPKSLNNIFL
jgi:hypothetical protein